MYAGISECLYDILRIIGGAIVSNKKLKILIGLIQDSFNSRTQEMRAVVSR
jgi:hypothetical protein